jgi:FKBP-type peptidyl-prolyl cis-trans isomerase SlyD
MMKSLAMLALLTGLVLSLPVAAVGAVIEEGSTVELEYTLTLAENGETVQSNVGNPPLSYVHGKGMLLPALEAELAGREATEEFELSVAAAEAYGPINPDMFREVELEKIPEEAREVGVLLSSPEYQGTIRVSEVRDDVVVLDFNHPLAGENLRFKVRVVSVLDSVPVTPESGAQ